VRKGASVDIVKLLVDTFPNFLEFSDEVPLHCTLPLRKVSFGGAAAVGTV
jgi:hypothetical protein